MSRRSGHKEGRRAFEWKKHVYVVEVGDKPNLIPTKGRENAMGNSGDYKAPEGYQH